MKSTISPAESPLVGTLRVPGDKSLSHRAVLFASLAEGRSALSGVLDSADVRATMDACQTLGARFGAVERDERGLRFEVTGWGATGPIEPGSAIDCGNSGTTARLLSGVLAGYRISVRLEGDASLSRRPMLRVIEPLSRMGATFEAAEGHTLPLTVHGSDRLAAITYASPVASAQVKTAVLLAGLHASGVTRVTEPVLSRDHTERLLPAFGVRVEVDDAPGASVHGPAALVANDVAVPGDPSSAAFPLIAAVIVPGSRVEVTGVSLNPTRTGFVRVLERMGARLTVKRTHESGTEPVGDITASHTPVLQATTVTAGEVASLVDEVPILAVAAARAAGTTRFEGVGELRVKESDRLDAVAEGLRAFGVPVRTGPDWLEIDGPARLRGADVDSLGDHRLAMAWTVAGLVSEGPSTVDRFEAVGVSYPGFGDDIATLLGGGTSFP